MSSHTIYFETIPRTIFTFKSKNKGGAGYTPSRSSREHYPLAYTLYMDIELQAREILQKNRRETNGFHYTVPSPSTYPYQWMWDSCFHAIVLASYDPDFAKAEIRSLLSKQFENGMIPHMVYWVPGDLHVYDWGV